MQKKFLNNRGDVIIFVMMLLAVLAVLGTSSLYLLGEQNKMVNRQDHSEDALYYAEAGYNEYLYQLNQDSKFYTTAASTALLSADQAYRDGYYRLQIILPTLSNPEVKIISTGWSAQSPSIRRTVKVSVFKRQFSQSVSLMGQMNSPNNGGPVSWGDGEQIHGPFHTNGDLNTTGSPHFYDKVSYVGNYTKSGSGPIFDVAGQPEHTTILAFPITNSQLALWGQTSYGGLTYTGSTCILLNGSTLKIRNGNTLYNSVPIPTSQVIYVTGDLWISGQLDGRLTIVANGNIYIVGKDPTNFTYSSATVTGGITYADQNIPTSASWTGSMTNDLLGLVTSANIMVYTRYWPTAGGGTTTILDSSIPQNINIQACLFAFGSNSTYGVTDYQNLSNKGFIHLIGAAITSYRSATYSGNVNGYKEDNWYDYRLSYDTPPHFLEPTNSGWEVRNWEEITN
jgi:Tfp pilus assembly protein PilX